MATTNIENNILISTSTKSKTYKVPYQVEKIERFAFEKSAVEELDASSTKILAPYAFAKSRIKMLKIAPSLDHIPEGLCINSKLEKIELPAGIKSIDVDAFSGTKIKEIILPEGLEGIGVNAFNHTYLNEIVIPDSIKYIKERAFANNIYLTKVELPENLEVIRDETFYCCHSLENIKLPKTLKRIGSNAFFGTKISQIEIPASVEKIGMHSFIKGATIILSEKQLEQNPHLKSDYTYYKLITRPTIDILLESNISRTLKEINNIALESER